MLCCGQTVWAASMNITVYDEVSGQALPYVIVSLHDTSGQQKASAMPLQVMDQVGKTFVPHVLPITVGTSVSFPNSDDIRHHLYSFDKPKPFELPLYEGTPTSPILFDKTGVVRLGCNIHDWMRGYIYILDTPLFAMSNADGQLTMQNIPAGDYYMEAWHPRIKTRKPLVSKLRLSKSEVKVLTLQVKVRKERKLKKRLRSRRDGY
ncbi:MAG: methylamine utilization protein [Ghiorsea sp.]|nr:methylamine utilization protein [Ghiorsea sp.]